MRTMWMLGAVVVAGCSGSEDRTLTGQVAAEATGVHAVDAAGARTDAALQDGAFSLSLDPGTVIVWVDVGDVPYVVTFPSTVGGTPDRTTIPDFVGTVDLGALTLHGAGLRSTTTTDWAEPENDPLAEVDTDDDGQSDLEDADDDGDGQHDDVDADDEGDGHDDAEEAGDGGGESETESSTD